MSGYTFQTNFLGILAPKVQTGYQIKTNSKSYIFYIKCSDSKYTEGQVNFTAIAISNVQLKIDFYLA